MIDSISSFFGVSRVDFLGGCALGLFPLAIYHFCVLFPYASDTRFTQYISEAEHKKFYSACFWFSFYFLSFMSSLTLYCQCLVTHVS